MFNKTIYNNESKVVAVTKEIEKTISPDKVTEMYDAVKEEVENTFVRAFPIKTDVLNGIVIEFINDNFTLQRKTLTRMVLNGKEYIFKEIHQVYEKFSDIELIDVFSRHYESVIRNTIMQDLANGLVRNRKK